MEFTALTLPLLKFLVVCMKYYNLNYFYYRYYLNIVFNLVHSISIQFRGRSIKASQTLWHWSILLVVLDQFCSRNFPCIFSTLSTYLCFLGWGWDVWTYWSIYMGPFIGIANFKLYQISWRRKTFWKHCGWVVSSWTENNWWLLTKSN